MSDKAVVVREYVRRSLLRLVVAVGLFDLCYPVVVFAYAQGSGQPYWRFFTAEGNFTAWWSSLQLLLLALVTWVIYRFRALAAGMVKTGVAWLWLVATAAFLLFAIDERFGFHEWLRDTVFRPLDLFTGSAYVIDGDVGLYLFLSLGLATLPLWWRELDHVPARRLLVAALMLTTLVVVIDSLTSRTVQRLPFWRFWDYPFEEVGEVWAQWLFLAAFVSQWRRWLTTETETASGP